jgi:hypothetical protein
MQHNCSESKQHRNKIHGAAHALCSPRGLGGHSATTPHVLQHALLSLTECSDWPGQLLLLSSSSPSSSMAKWRAFLAACAYSSHSGCGSTSWELVMTSGTPERVLQQDSHTQPAEAQQGKHLSARNAQHALLRTMCTFTTSQQRRNKGAEVTSDTAP